MNAKDRLLLFLAEKKLGQGKFEEIAKISNGYINNCKGSIGTIILSKIGIAFPELNTDWVTTGNGDMIKSENQSMPSDSNFMLVPLYSHDVVGGINNQESDTNGYVTGYMPFVNAKQGDICVPVTNNSMVPTYPPGTIVQIRKLDYWKEFVEFGKVHIIELMDERRLIKVIRKGKDDNHFTLVSHNKEYDDAEISIKFIQAVWLVLSKYEKVVM